MDIFYGPDWEMFQEIAENALSEFDQFEKMWKNQRIKVYINEESNRKNQSLG